MSEAVSLESFMVQCLITLTLSSGGSTDSQTGGPNLQGEGVNLLLFGKKFPKSELELKKLDPGVQVDNGAYILFEPLSSHCIGVFSKWSGTFAEFTEFREFRESEKSLRHELGSV